MRPRVSADAQMLVIEASPRQTREAPSVLVGGPEIVCDLDADGGLWRIDVIFPQRFWTIDDEMSGWPLVREALANRHPGSLVVQQETRDVHDLDWLQVEVVSDPTQTTVLVVFDTAVHAAHGVELSERCVAVLDGERLLGFWVRLG